MAATDIETPVVGDRWSCVAVSSDVGKWGKAFRALFGSGCVAWGLSCACGGAAPSKTDPASAVLQKKAGTGALIEVLQAARAAEHKGDRARALELYLKAEALGHTPVPRAKLLLDVGRYEQTWETFQAATAPGLVVLSARALERLGRVEEAQRHLVQRLGWQAPAEAPPSCEQLGSAQNVGDAEDEIARGRALLLWGELELERGRRKTAEVAFAALTDCARRAYEVGSARAATALVYAGQAAASSRKYELANELFNLAETNLEGSAARLVERDLLLYRAELFLEKHDEAQAETIAGELRQKWPHDPEVQLYLAQFKADAEFDFAEAERLAQALLETNPCHTGALFLLGGIELRDMNLRRAAEYVERGLETNPRDLDLLSLRATIRFLEEDHAGFDAQLEEIARLSPGNVRPYLVFGEYAEWEHRYPDLEKYLRRAARLDRDAAEVRSRLGLTLVRAASDAAGVVELNRAYDLDPYDVRVVNTLNLYEKIIPQDYVSISRGPFRYRFPKAEAALLERYVPTLLETAYEQMRDRYGYTPPSPIDIELYATSAQFAVRTSGVPSVGIQGVCFGHKLATVTPVGAPGNLGMTLWHELGHVFHIGLSRYRVPRYLTEGLAEWGTARRNVGWSREMDQELYEVVKEGRLPPLSQMSRAFTHAESGKDIAAAYYASGILSEWLVERHGEERLLALLAELGQGKLAHEAIPRVFGSSWAELDRGFAAHLTQKLGPIAAQFTPARARASSTALYALLKEGPASAELELQLALALLDEGKIAEAKPLIAAAPAADPQFGFLRVRLALAEENLAQARAGITGLLGAGVDGFALRMLSARLHLAEKQMELAAHELGAALGFDPTAIEPRQMLVSYHRERGEAAAELEQLRAWAQLSEHDPGVHRRLLEVLIQQDQIPDAMAAARLAVWVDLAGMETHRLAGLAFARGKQWDQAEFEWQSALLCPATPDQLLQLGQTWTEELQRAGRSAQAARAKKQVAGALEATLRLQGGLQSPPR